MLLLFWGSNILYPLDKTESLQLDIARTMHAERSLAVPRVSGGLYFDKPPLPYWVAWPVFQFFPADPWLARLGSAVASTVGVLATVLFVHHQGRSEAEPPRRSLHRALLAGLILACLPGYAVFAHVALHDSYLTTCITVAAAGLYALLFGQLQGAAGLRALAVVVGLAMGVGFLAKGLLAWALPVAVVLGFAALTRQGWPLLRRWPQLLLSAALAVAIPLPWLLAAFHEAGPAFLAGFLGRSNLARVTSTVDDHAGPWFYYLPVVVVLSFPWGLVAIPNRARWRQLLGQARQRDAGNRPADLQLFALVWLVLTVLLLSFANTKLPHYILSCLPPLAILAAFNLVPEPCDPSGRPDPFSRQPRFYTILGTGTAVVLAALGLVLTPVVAGLIKPDRVFPEYTTALASHLESVPFRAQLVLMALVVAGLLLWIPQRRAALVTAWALVAVLSFSSVVPGLATVYRQHRQGAILDLADQVAGHTAAGVPIVILGKSYHSVALRSGHPILRLDGWPEVVALQRSSQGHAFEHGLVVFAPRHRMLTDAEIQEAGLRVAAVDERQNLLAVELRSAGPAGA